MIETSQHPGSETINAYVDGQLPVDEEQDAQQHHNRVNVGQSHQCRKILLLDRHEAEQAESLDIEQIFDQHES